MYKVNRMLKTKSERSAIAESAISLLKDGLSNGNKAKIIAAYEIVEDDNFSWDNLDVLYLEWDELIEEANVFLFT